MVNFFRVLKTSNYIILPVALDARRQSILVGQHVAVCLPRILEEI